MNKDLFHGISEQRKAGIHRMDDARSLLAVSRWRGAMYLAGYAVECLLKTKLMRRYNCRNLRDLESELQAAGKLALQAGVFTHHLEWLLRWNEGLERLRRSEREWLSFNLVNRWVPAWRYNPDLSNKEDATAFLEAVDIVVNWIENNI